MRHADPQAPRRSGGLRNFGINLMTLPPGGWSSQRHWHSHEDEFVHLLEGELTLVEDGGETVLRAGDCAAFPKGTSNGHHLINRSAATAVYLEVGSRQPTISPPAPISICKAPTPTGGSCTRMARRMASGSGARMTVAGFTAARPLRPMRLAPASRRSHLMS